MVEQRKQTTAEYLQSIVDSAQQNAPEVYPFVMEVCIAVAKKTMKRVPLGSGFFVPVGDPQYLLHRLMRTATEISDDGLVHYDAFMRFLQLHNHLSIR